MLLHLRKKEGGEKNVRPSILRKALALTLVLAFTLAAVPPQAGAEVLETKLAIVYTDTDAAQKAEEYQQKYNLQIFPKKAAYTRKITEGYSETYAVPTELWSFGDPARTREVLTTLDRLEQTVPSLVYLLQKQRIFLLGLYSFKTDISPEAVGVRFAPGIIYLAGQRYDAEYTLLHELGHSLADALFSTLGYDFSGANTLAREYLRIRGYPASWGLSRAAQLKLDWQNRAAEWFAEDFAYWAATKLQMDRRVTIPGTGKAEVLRWFDRVLGDATVPVYAYTAEGVKEAQGREVVSGKVYVQLQFFRELGFSSDELLAVLPRVHAESYAIKDTIYVPLRKFAVALGLSVYWDGQAISVRR